MKTVVCGVGNRLRGDDAFGPLVIDAFESRNKNVLFLDCGSAPENFIGKVMHAAPEKIIIVDAFDMKQKPGTICRIDLDKIQNTSYSTHNAPLSMFVKAFKDSCAEVIIIGFQPETIEFGKEVSSETRIAVEKTKAMIENLIQS
ncbi:MAG: hydrogenase maturation peptidase HycI [Candidatus Aenigmarchaeota archaeon]|nr:hydrogenase maturation peptidase HycI [Candidatus Aenigmarchaeota archaeon]